MNLSPFSEIGIGLGGAGVGGLVTGLFGRRRARADEAAVLSDIAVRMVAPLHEELQGVRREFREYRRHIEDREARRQAAAALHIQWDIQVAESLRVLGQDVPAPPPLDAAVTGA